jgi:hypothetical protein
VMARCGGSASLFDNHLFLCPRPSSSFKYQVFYTLEQNRKTLIPLE